MWGSGLCGGLGVYVDIKVGVEVVDHAVRFVVSVRFYDREDFFNLGKAGLRKSGVSVDVVVIQGVFALDLFVIFIGRRALPFLPTRPQTGYC